MPPSRRSFLRHLLALPIAATFDVERLLWVPGQLITVPVLPSISIAEINAITLQTFLPRIEEDFFTQTPLYEYWLSAGRRPN